MTLMTQILREGQPYVDEPVYVKPKKEVLNPIRLSVSAAFNGGQPVVPSPIVVRHERVNLRWIKPDGTPKYSR